MKYTTHQHRHNFYVWAAARASQRGFATVPVLRAALEDSGVEKFAKRPMKLGAFDELHRRWCCSIRASLKSSGIGGVPYGRAAKLANVYLKGMIVLSDTDCKAAAIIHPPVDRILLRNIAADVSVDGNHRKFCRGINWTQLDEGEYFDLIFILREINGDEPFWKIERYWDVTTG